MKKIIGIAGTFASGKDAAAEFLVKQHGYLHVSTGDLIRAETAKRGHSIHRDNLVWVANKLRHTVDEGIFVDRALQKFNSDKSAKGIVITGIRHPGEVAKLKEHGGYLLFTDAPIEKRFKWAKSRGRLEDKTTLSGFKQQEQRELAHPDPGGQSILAVRKLADIAVLNDSTEPAFFKSIEKAIG